MDRRTFLKLGGVLAVTGVTIPGSQLVMAAASGATGATAVSSRTKWTMVVDLDKCNGCGKCEEACRLENNVPLYTGDEAQFTAYWIRIAEAKREITGIESEESPIPLLCSHCDSAPCAHVCPTKATFQRADGLVMIDEHRCIGCRYCVIACPYHARSMVFKDTTDEEWTNRDVPKLMRGVASKCTFCEHRLMNEDLPASERMPKCVLECPHKALTFGDRKDEHSDVAQLLVKSGRKAQVLRPNLEIGANVFYLGL